MVYTKIIVKFYDQNRYFDCTFDSLNLRMSLRISIPLICQFSRVLIHI